MLIEAIALYRCIRAPERKGGILPARQGISRGIFLSRLPGISAQAVSPAALDLMNHMTERHDMPDCIPGTNAMGKNGLSIFSMDKTVNHEEFGMKITINKKALCVFLLIVLVWCIFSVLRQEKTTESLPVAQALYSLLKPYAFDGVEYLEAPPDCIRLFRYENQENSSWLRKRTVAVLELPETARDAKNYFRDMRTLRGGLFLATKLTWDTEWSGLYIAESMDG